MLFVPPSIPLILAQTEIVSDSTFKTYTEDDNRFSIEYPDDWVLPGGHPDALVNFSDKYSWTTYLQVFWNEDDTRDSSSDSKVFRGIETDHYKQCRDESLDETNRECSDFKLAESYVMYTHSNEKVYFVSMTYTLEFSDVVTTKIEGKKYPVTTVIAIIFDGDDSWRISGEADGTYAKYADEILYMIKSFSLDPTPVQTQSPTPDVITSDSTFKKYTFDANMFSIDYPSNWIISQKDVEALAVFDDKRNWKTDFQVFWNEDDPLGNRTDSKILGDMEWAQYEMCYAATFAADNRKCTDFKTLDSYIMYTNDNRKVYLKIVTYTVEWENYARGQNIPIVRTLGIIFDGDDSWALAVESMYTDNRHSDEILYMIKSFSLDPDMQKQVQPTTTSVITIPAWIKNNAGWWADGQIDDGSFVSGLQWLISNGIMTIPPTEQGAGSDNVIPAWIKNNAEWWAEGQIDDNTFVSGIQYLIKVGIIVVTHS